MVEKMIRLDLIISSFLLILLPSECTQNAMNQVRHFNERVWDNQTLCVYVFDRNRTFFPNNETEPYLEVAPWKKSSITSSCPFGNLLVDPRNVKFPSNSMGVQIFDRIPTLEDAVSDNNEGFSEVYDIFSLTGIKPENLLEMWHNSGNTGITVEFMFRPLRPFYSTAKFWQIGRFSRKSNFTTCTNKGIQFLLKDATEILANDYQSGFGLYWNRFQRSNPPLSADTIENQRKYFDFQCNINKDPNYIQDTLSNLAGDAKSYIFNTISGGAKSLLPDKCPTYEKRYFRNSFFYAQNATSTLVECYKAYKVKMMGVLDNIVSSYQDALNEVVHTLTNLPNTLMNQMQDVLDLQKRINSCKEMKMIQTGGSCQWQGLTTAERNDDYARYEKELGKLNNCFEQMKTHARPDTIVHLTTTISRIANGKVYANTDIRIKKLDYSAQYHWSAAQSLQRLHVFGTPDEENEPGFASTYPELMLYLGNTPTLPSSAEADPYILDYNTNWVWPTAIDGFLNNLNELYLGFKKKALDINYCEVLRHYENYYSDYNYDLPYKNEWKYNMENVDRTKFFNKPSIELYLFALHNRTLSAQEAQINFEAFLPDVGHTLEQPRVFVTEGEWSAIPLNHLTGIYTTNVHLQLVTLPRLGQLQFSLDSNKENIITTSTMTNIITTRMIYYKPEQINKLGNLNTIYTSFQYKLVDPLQGTSIQATVPICNVSILIRPMNQPPVVYDTIVQVYATDTFMQKITLVPFTDRVSRTFDTVFLAPLATGSLYEYDPLQPNFIGKKIAPYSPTYVSTKNTTFFYSYRGHYQENGSYPYFLEYETVEFKGKNEAGAISPYSATLKIEIINPYSSFLNTITTQLDTMTVITIDETKFNIASLLKEIPVYRILTLPSHGVLYQYDQNSLSPTFIGKRISMIEKKQGVRIQDPLNRIIYIPNQGYTNWMKDDDPLQTDSFNWILTIPNDNDAHTLDGVPLFLRVMSPYLAPTLEGSDVFQQELKYPYDPLYWTLLGDRRPIGCPNDNVSACLPNDPVRLSLNLTNPGRKIRNYRVIGEFREGDKFCGLSGEAAINIATVLPGIKVHPYRYKGIATITIRGYLNFSGDSISVAETLEKYLIYFDPCKYETEHYINITVMDTDSNMQVSKVILGKYTKKDLTDTGCARVYSFLPLCVDAPRWARVTTTILLFAFPFILVELIRRLFQLKSYFLKRSKQKDPQDNTEYSALLLNMKYILQEDNVVAAMLLLRSCENRALLVCVRSALYITDLSCQTTKLICLLLFHELRKTSQFDALLGYPSVTSITLALVCKSRGAVWLQGLITSPFKEAVLQKDRYLATIRLLEAIKDTMISFPSELKFLCSVFSCAIPKVFPSIHPVSAVNLLFTNHLLVPFLRDPKGYELKEDFDPSFFITLAKIIFQVSPFNQSTKESQNEKINHLRENYQNLLLPLYDSYLQDKLYIEPARIHAEDLEIQSLSILHVLLNHYKSKWKKLAFLEKHFLSKRNNGNTVAARLFQVLVSLSPPSLTYESIVEASSHDTLYNKSSNDDLLSDSINLNFTLFTSRSVSNNQDIHLQSPKTTRSSLKQLTRDYIARTPKTITTTSPSNQFVLTPKTVTGSSNQFESELTPKTTSPSNQFERKVSVTPKTSSTDPSNQFKREVSLEEGHKSVWVPVNQQDINDQSGSVETYYWNTVTQETRWELPPEE